MAYWYQPMFKNNDNKNRIFRDESILLAGHNSIRPVKRDDEISRIANALEPLTHRHDPENLLVFGPSGAGKTTCVNHVFENLESETRVKTIWINCWQYNTRPSLLTELLVQLGYPAPRKGKPVDELLSKLREWLDKNRGFAVALDEFDQLDDRTEVVYDLQLLNEEAENSVGIVMISNQHPQEIELDPRSRSRLNCRTLEFESYSAAQLEEILSERVEQAFLPGAVPDEAVADVADQVASQGGDCREALSSLLQAGRRAQEEGCSEVSPDDL